MKKVNRVALVVLVVSASILVITFMAVSLGGCSNSVTDQGLEDSIPSLARISNVVCYGSLSQLLRCSLWQRSKNR